MKTMLRVTLDRLAGAAGLALALFSHSAMAAELEWSTYLGSSSDDYARALAVAPDGTIYVTGSAGAGDFPTTPGAHRETGPVPPSYRVGFVTRLSADGRTVLASTKLWQDEQLPRDIAVASDGSVVVLGGGDSMHLAKFDANLTTMSASYVHFGLNLTYALALAPDDSVYVAGLSSDPGLPAGAGAQPDLRGGLDYVLLRLDADLTGIEALTYLGGAAGREENLLRPVPNFPKSFASASLQVAADGSVWFCGGTAASDFPAVGGFGGLGSSAEVDAVLVQASADLSTWLLATRFGGSGGDEATALHLDGLGHVYLTGSTASLDFPFGAGPDALYHTAAFVLKLDLAGGSVDYAAKLGGVAAPGLRPFGRVWPRSIAVDDRGAAAVLATTTGDPVLLVDPVQDTALGHLTQLYLARLNPLGTGPEFATYLGGSGGGLPAAFPWAEIATDVSVSGSEILLGGLSCSPDFPAVDGYQLENAGVCDAVVSRIHAPTAPYEVSALDRRSVAPLRVQAGSAGRLHLEWEDVPLEDLRHRVHAGSLSRLHDARSFDHRLLPPADLVASSTDIDMPPGDSYFLISTTSTGPTDRSESSYGRGSDGTERPASP